MVMRDKTHHIVRKSIEVQHVTQQFKVGDEVVTALNDASLRIRPNSFNIIYGPSGSGKTTLLNVLAGISPPDTGKLTVHGHNIYELNDDELAHFRAKHIGFVQQTSHWVQSLNVIENVAMPLYFLGYTRSYAKRVALRALERVNMTAYAHKNPALLSGGEQQRIAMVRALVNDPLFMIVDEPTGNLDTANGMALMKLLLDMQVHQKRTIILVTHNMEYIGLADQLFSIHDGNVETRSQHEIHTMTGALLRETRDRIHYLKEIKSRAN